jgi:hypothetical protein
MLLLLLNGLLLLGESPHQVPSSARARRTPLKKGIFLVAYTAHCPKQALRNLLHLPTRHPVDRDKKIIRIPSNIKYSI